MGNKQGHNPQKQENRNRTKPNTQSWQYCLISLYFPEHV